MGSCAGWGARERSSLALSKSHSWDALHLRETSFVAACAFLSGLYSRRSGRPTLRLGCSGALLVLASTSSDARRSHFILTLGDAVRFFICSVGRQATPAASRPTQAAVQKYSAYSDLPSSSLPFSLPHKHHTAPSHTVYRYKVAVPTAFDACSSHETARSRK